MINHLTSIQSFHWAQGICLIECLEEIFSQVDCLNRTSRALMSVAVLELHSAGKVTNFLRVLSMLTQRLVAQPESIALLMIYPVPAGIWELGGGVR